MLGSFGATLRALGDNVATGSEEQERGNRVAPRAAPVMRPGDQRMVGPISGPGLVDGAVRGGGHERVEPADGIGTCVSTALGSRRPEVASRSGTIWSVTTQIAVRLPDELVAYVDQAVSSGRVKSRAELVSRLIARDLRRNRAEQDLQRLAEAGALEDPEALAIAVATSVTPVADD